MRKYLTLFVGILFVIAFVAVFMIAKSHDLLYSREDVERDLFDARTPAQELAAFDRIARNTRVHFSLHDVAGQQLGMSNSDWPNKAHLIRPLWISHRQFVVDTVTRRFSAF
jgi:hypothetical protein